MGGQSGKTWTEHKEGDRKARHRAGQQGRRIRKRAAVLAERCAFVSTRRTRAM